MNTRIRFAGHTMGMPGRDIYECITLAREIGYDAIEVRVAANGQINSETITDDEARKIRAFAEQEGIEIACLTSYYKDFVNPETRESVIRNLCRVAELADLLNCPLMRVYGGPEPYTLKGTWFCDVWSLSVSGLREVAEYAAKFGVRLCIETHSGSLTMTIRDTVRLIQDVSMSNVGILFDYAWVELGGAEFGAEAVRAAAPYIFHVHIKDWQLSSRTPLTKRSCLMGEGTVAWEEVLAELKRVGYTGYVCDEYEKYWYPDELPEPEIGMKHNLEYVKERLL
ncbi:MAG: sugar phosphate isomerase/epimerase [Ruminococcaceae bacterium]|nr:sugar phosphate isomerase/epimerase [Oscillospiraceae bacterium]